MGDKDWKHVGAVAGLGDLDQDHVPDFALVPKGGPGTANRVDIYSGATFRLIRSFQVTNAQRAQVHSLAGGIDADGDGVADVVIGFEDGDGKPRVMALSGKSNSPLYSVTPKRDDSASYGCMVAGIADVNGDNVRDIAVGVPGELGMVYVLSSANGEVVHSVSPPEYPDSDPVRGRMEDLRVRFFGWSLMGVPDLDGDGVGDVWSVALDFAVVAFSGKTGGRLIEVDIKEIRGSEHRFRMGEGATSALVGDCDGDAIADIVMAAAEVVLCHGSSVSLISGRTAGTLHRLELEELLGNKGCSCTGWGEGADVARAQRRGEAVVALAAMTCGTVGMFEVSEKGFDLIWLRELE